jgi:hypothetical protein
MIISGTVLSLVLTNEGIENAITHQPEPLVEVKAALDAPGGGLLAFRLGASAAKEYTLGASINLDVEIDAPVFAKV